MSEHDEGSNDEAERALRALFAHAQPRVPPPADATEEIRRAAFAEWDAATGRRVWLRRAGAFAAAAALAAVAVVVGLRLDTAPHAVVARVERLQGGVELVVRGGAEPLGAATALEPGAVLSTAGGQVALRLADGGSLRVGPRSRLTLASADSIELESGVLYFDSEDARSRPLSIATAYGTVRDVGTQFMARVDAAALDLRVRGGGVALVRPAEAEARAGAGERLVAARGAAVRREPAAAFGDDWAWAERLAPPFAIDGRKLGEFLDWVGAQTGRKIELGDATAERLARETVLTGSIDLEPLPKLVAVLALTDLEYSLDGDRIVIRSK